MDVNYFLDLLFGSLPIKSVSTLLNPGFVLLCFSVCYRFLAYFRVRSNLYWSNLLKLFLDIFPKVSPAHHNIWISFHLTLLCSCTSCHIHKYIPCTLSAWVDLSYLPLLPLLQLPSLSLVQWSSDDKHKSPGSLVEGLERIKVSKICTWSWEVV